MRLAPRTARTILCCKLKRVDARLPLHVHSAGQERVGRKTSGNPVSANGASKCSKSSPQCSAVRLRTRLESELSVEAWRRLESAARRLGTDIEGLLAQVLG